MRKSMASIGYTLVVASSGATRRPLLRYHTLFGFGARGQSAHYFFDMKDSCTRHHNFAVLNTVLISLQRCDRCMDQEYWWRPWIRHRGDVKKDSQRTYIHILILKDSVLFINVFLLIVRAYYNVTVYRRLVGPGKSNHSEPRGFLSTIAKSSKSEMTKQWRSHR
jgi:hypothetical protein